MRVLVAIAPLLAGCSQLLGIEDLSSSGWLLTVTVDGAGRVSSSTHELDCTRRCELRVGVDDQVQLTAEAFAGVANSFEGWDGASCAGADCVVGSDGDLEVIARFDNPNLAFLAGVQVNAQLGGIDVADGYCQDAADAVGLGGTYLAWISSSIEGAASRLGGASGWIRTDGVPLAGSVVALSEGRLHAPLLVDIAGARRSRRLVLTGTYNGLVAADTCADWTGTAGVALGGTSEGVGDMFSSYHFEACNLDIWDLYCLGVDPDAPAAPTPPPVIGRRAFVTDRDWIPSGGVIGADLFCQEEADLAVLGGTYRALLATTTASAGSRLGTGGATWVRLDGRPLTATAPELLTADHWEVTPNLTPSGATLGIARVFSGSPALDQPGTAVTTCLDWTTSSTNEDGLFGLAGDTQVSSFLAEFGPDVTERCSEAHRLACFEQ